MIFPAPAASETSVLSSWIATTGLGAAMPRAHAGAKPLNVFILAGQSNME
jgi:hypothetical protein